MALPKSQGNLSTGEQRSAEDTSSENRNQKRAKREKLHISCSKNAEWELQMF